jgi:hypothetical protein
MADDPAPPQDGAKGQSSFSPWNVLMAARKAVPAVDYALGAAGIAAAGSIVTAFLGRDKVSIIIFGGMLVAMILLFVFARLVASTSPLITYAGYFLTWAVVLFFVTFLVFTATAMAIGQPVIWAGVLGVNKPSPTKSLVDQIDYGDVGRNQAAIASLLQMALAGNLSEKDTVVRELKTKLTYPEERDFDNASRTIRKALFEAILKIRNSDVHSEFSHGELTNMDLVGLDAQNADLDGVNFRGAFLIGGDFTGANLAGVDFSSALLRNVIFEGANLHGTVFNDADWFNALRLTASQMKAVNPTGLRTCPRAKNGSYSQKAFERFADSIYALGFTDWTEDEQRQTSQAWTDYMMPQGVCAAVAANGRFARDNR